MDMFVKCSLNSSTIQFKFVVPFSPPPTECAVPVPHVTSIWFTTSSGWQLIKNLKRYSSPVTGLEWPRGFQEVKVPRLHDNSTGWW